MIIVKICVLYPVSPVATHLVFHAWFCLCPVSNCLSCHLLHYLYFPAGWLAVVLHDSHAVHSDQSLACEASFPFYKSIWRCLEAHYLTFPLNGSETGFSNIDGIVYIIVVYIVSFIWFSLVMPCCLDV